MTTADCDRKLQPLLPHHVTTSQSRLLEHKRTKISCMDGAHNDPDKTAKTGDTDELIKIDPSGNGVQQAAESPLTSQVIYNKNESGGPAHWVELTLIPSINSDGEVTHFESVERDISL